MSGTELKAGPDNVNQSRRAFFEINRLRLDRCLAPGLTCERTAIRAHSIQNAFYLDLLVNEGHLIQLTRRFESDRGPTIDYARVGRRQASTFTGLCSVHDAQFFHPIENSRIDFDDSWHLFLLAYRAVLRETHATMEAGSKIQSAYLARVDAGLDPKDLPSPAGIYATQRLMVAYETYQFKERFDASFRTEDPSLTEHEVVHLNVAAPSVAASALFSIDDLVVDGETARICLTILPTTPSETVVVFSYLHDQAAPARARLARVIQASGAHQLYEISRLLLNSCENFVINPRVFSEWDVGKKDAIREYFFRTLFSDDLGTEDHNLMLFQLDT